MQELMIIERTPLRPEVEQEAVRRLGVIVADQAERRRVDLEKSLTLLRAELQNASRHKIRAATADRLALEAAIRELEDLRAHPEPGARARLAKLLALVGGPLKLIEIGTDRVEALVVIDRDGPQRVRIAVVPQAISRQRLAMQHLDPGQERVALIVPCYGERGQAYIQSALDRVDLASLFLLGIGYLHDNLRVA